MNFVKLTSLFGLLTLVVLSLGFTSAQVPDTCIQLSSVNFPSAVSSTQGSFQGTFNIVFGPGSCNPRTINSIQLSSFIGSSATGNWAIGTNSIPFIINSTSNNPTLVSATFTIPNSASGVLNTNATITTNSGLVYMFTLPAVIINQPSSNITISGLPTSPVSLSQNATFTVTNNGNFPLSIQMSEPTSLGVTFNPQSFQLQNSTQSTLVTAVLSALSNLRFGIHNVEVKAQSGNQISTGNFDVRKTFCRSGEKIDSNLTIEEVSWDNNGEGDEDSWEFLDEIEVEVKVQNNNQRNDVDAVVELGLFDSSGNNIADDLTFLDSDNEKIDVNINDDDDETVTFRFKVPADFDVGDYKLAVKVYDDDAGETRDCRDSSNDLDNTFYQSINIDQTSDEGRFVVIDDLELDSPISCGQAVTGQFTVFNVGQDDQDRVRVTIRNNDLGINLVREITNNLDQGDDETLDFSFQVPATARNGRYALEIFTEYDYRNGVYRQDADETFDAPFELIGCSGNLGGSSGSLTNLQIDAVLDSDAKPGEELVVVATLRNTGTEDATYSISARGYSSWADLRDISESTLEIDAGESKQVVFTLMVNDDASGTQSFDIQAASGGRTQIQPVEVRLGSKSSIFSSGNSLIWIIGLVNLVLIILIIVVAVRVSRR